MEIIFYILVVGAINEYCRNTDTPGCKAVAEYFDGAWYFFLFLIIVGVIAGIIYFFVK